MNKLDKLALKYNSDKYGKHFYTKIYEKFMSKKKNENINLFEIGIGGYVQGKDYSDPYKGGESLKMWRDYFKKGTICGLDIYEKKLVLGSRVNIYKGSQTDPKVLNKIIKEQKKFDYIIDDGSHINKDVIFTFEYMFKSLKEGGYYFVEDTLTSYLRDYGGEGAYLKKNNTIINYFKNIVDKINYKEIENPYYKSDYFSKNITAIHFYHNLIVIKKNKNLEKSFLVINNKKKLKNSKNKKRREIKQKIKYFLFNLKAKIYELVDLIKI